MHVIIYVSEYTSNDLQISEDLKNIERTSKAKNPLIDITGVLFYHNGKFLQILEGEKTHIDVLLDIIEEDPRHKNISIVLYEEVEERCYSEWNMDTFNLSDKESLDVDKLREAIAIYKKVLHFEVDELIEFYEAMLKHEV